MKFDKIGREFFVKYSFYDLPPGVEFDSAFDQKLTEQLTELEKGDNYEKMIARTKKIEAEAQPFMKKVVDYYGGLGDHLYFSLTFMGAAVASARLLDLDVKTPLFQLSVNLYYDQPYDLESLLSHELTHNYHMTQNEELAIKTLSDSAAFFGAAKYYWFFFLEGIGSYGEIEIPNALPAEYESITEEDVAHLSSEFLKIYKLQIFAEDQGKNFARWFVGTGEDIGGKSYPQGTKIGYYLGYRAIKDMVERKGINFNEIVTYDVTGSKLADEIKTSLEYLSKMK